VNEPLLRAWAVLLVLGVHAVGVGVGAMLLLAVQRLAGARWDEPLRPVLRRLSMMVPVGGVTVLAALALSWAVPLLPGVRGEVAVTGAVFARAVALLGGWSLLAVCLQRRARHGSAEIAGRWAVAVLLFTVPAGWIAATDWLMSLNAGWTSTIFGFYVLCGFPLSTLATLLVRGARPGPYGGRLSLPRRELVFATVLCGSLWAYAWYCQYLLIWYANLPHETHYFAVRTDGTAAFAFYGAIALKWAVPVALLFAAGRRLAVQFAAGAIALVGHLLDLYVVVVPALGIAPSPGPIEIVGMVGVAAATLWGGGAVPLQYRPPTAAA
jgi:hypothetical protein